MNYNPEHLLSIVIYGLGGAYVASILLLIIFLIRTPMTDD